MIEVRNLTCKYDQTIVLDDISLNLPRHVSILGANGSGKSTLTKALCDLIEYQGEIIIDAKNLQEYDEKQRAKKISYIPTKLEFYDEFLTVEEFVLLGRFTHKKQFFDYSAQDKAIANEKIDFLNLCALKKHPLHSLSSGESALVLIAQALAQESQIIIFDEPTANLDPKNSKIIAHYIKNLKQTHQTVLITHDIHLAHFMQSPVLFLKEKKTVLYEKDDFFTDAALSELYGVRFSSLELCYE